MTRGVITFMSFSPFMGCQNVSSLIPSGFSLNGIVLRFEILSRDDFFYALQFSFGNIFTHAEKPKKLFWHSKLQQVSTYEF